MTLNTHKGSLTSTFYMLKKNKEKSTAFLSDFAVHFWTPFLNTSPSSSGLLCLAVSFVSFATLHTHKLPVVSCFASHLKLTLKQ